MIWRYAALLFSLCCITIGCDTRHDDVPPPSRPPTEEPKRPTTQFLQDSPRTKLQLGGAPLMIMAPAGWEIKSHESAIDTFEGPAPTADIQIEIVRSQVRLKKDQVDGIVATLAAPKDPGPLVHVDTRGDAKIVSLVKVTHVGGEDLVDWRLRTFTPSGDQYVEYDLSFVGLSRSDYDQNKDFLEKMLQSITYEKADDLQ